MSDLDDLLHQEQQREAELEAQREAELANWRDPEAYNPYEEERRRMYEEEMREELEEYDAALAEPLPIPGFLEEVSRLYSGKHEPGSVAAQLVELLASIADEKLESETEIEVARVIAAFEAMRNRHANVTRGWIYKRWNREIYSLLDKAGVNIHPDHEYVLEKGDHITYRYEPYTVIEFEELAKLKKLGWKVEIQGNTAVHFPGYAVVVNLTPPK